MTDVLFRGSQAIVYNTFLGSPQGRRRILAETSTGMSRVRHTAAVFPMG